MGAPVSHTMAKLLYISPFCDIPPLAGGAQRSIHLLGQLAGQHQVHVLTPHKANASAFATWAVAQGITVDWFSQPAPQESGLRGRVFARFPPGFGDPAGLVAAIDRAWGASGPFAVVYFATQWAGLAATVKRRPARIILDLYDVYTPIAQARARGVPPWRPYHWLFRLEAARVQGHEVRLLRSADRVLTASPEDANLVRRLHAGAAVTVIPNGVHLPPAAPRSPSPATVLMVASYSYGPNAEGFRWFFHEVWPHIRQGAPILEDE